MTSLKQQQSNAQNVQHSTGPQSVDGKSRAKLNATVHNLRGQFKLLPHENPAVYELMLQGFLTEYAPKGMREHKLVLQLVQCQWQIDRTNEHIRNAYTQADSIEEQWKQMDKFTLYRQRFLREFTVFSKALEALQRERKNNPDAVWVEEETLHTPAQWPPEVQQEAEDNPVPTLAMLPSQRHQNWVDKLQQAKQRLSAAIINHQPLPQPKTAEEAAMLRLADTELALEEEENDTPPPAQHT